MSLVTLHKRLRIQPRTHHVVTVFSDHSLPAIESLDLPDELKKTIAKEADNHNRKEVKTLSWRSDETSIDFIFPTGRTMDEIADAVAESARSGKFDRACLIFEPMEESILRRIFDSFTLGAYAFSAYKSDAKPFGLAFSYTALSDELRAELESRAFVLSCVYSARDLANTPANDKFPEVLAERISAHDWHHTDVRTLDRFEIEREGMNLLLAVAAGSAREPRVVVFERFADPSKPTIAIIGKGVTFDSGGLQIKPTDPMVGMHMDMSGAAVVASLARAIDRLPSLPVNVVCIVGLTENMTGSHAYRPGDIYRSHAGKTVEIANTDAEGRLVLADLLSYAEKTYHPKTAVTLATLTGACLHALGFDYAGVMGDDERTIARLMATEEETDDRFVRLPIDRYLRAACKGQHADLANQTKSAYAGSSMGGAFLSHFVDKTKLVHIDAAGPLMRDKARGVYPK
jgi:leucyl aminopeptidase